MVFIDFFRFTIDIFSLESILFVLVLVELIRADLIDERERAFNVESFIYVIEHAGNEQVQAVAVGLFDDFKQILDFFFSNKVGFEIIDAVDTLQCGHGKRDETKREYVGFLLIDFFVVNESLAAQSCEEFRSKEAFRFDTREMLAVSTHARRQEADVRDLKVRIVINEDGFGWYVAMGDALWAKIVDSTKNLFD